MEPWVWVLCGGAVVFAILVAWMQNTIDESAEVDPSKCPKCKGTGEWGIIEYSYGACYPCELCRGTGKASPREN
jgi:hypothetical protein